MAYADDIAISINQEVIHIASELFMKTCELSCLLVNIKKSIH